MAKRLTVVASGRTERNALPHLLQHLETQGIRLVDVRIPAHNRCLTPDEARRVIRATWFEMHARGAPPDKFVVLVDADAQSIEEASGPFGDLSKWTRDIGATVLVSVAKWHLEAWFFADDRGLRGFMERSLGHVDTSAPDEIQNPKHHLKQILGQPYTAQVAGAIAQRLSADMLRARSPSFAQFEMAAMNGSAAPK